MNNCTQNGIAAEKYVEDISISGIPGERRRSRKTIRLSISTGDGSS